MIFPDLLTALSECITADRSMSEYSSPQVHPELRNVSDAAGRNLSALRAFFDGHRAGLEAANVVRAIQRIYSMNMREMRFLLCALNQLDVAQLNATTYVELLQILRLASVKRVWDPGAATVAATPRRVERSSSLYPGAPGGGFDPGPALVRQPSGVSAPYTPATFVWELSEVTLPGRRENVLHDRRTQKIYEPALPGAWPRPLGLFDRGALIEPKRSGFFEALDQHLRTQKARFEVRRPPEPRAYFGSRCDPCARAGSKAQRWPLFFFSPLAPSSCLILAGGFYRV